MRGRGLPPHHLTSSTGPTSWRATPPPSRPTARFPRAALQRQPRRHRRRRKRPALGRWEDPFPKPCYLFALVAAKLDVLWTTDSRPLRPRGRAAPSTSNPASSTCGFAMEALKKSMRWDENVFGLESISTLHDRRRRRLQHGRDGEQGPQHLQHQVRAGPPRHRHRHRLPTSTASSPTSTSTTGPATASPAATGSSSR
jgi:hypothetical protein